MDFNLLKEFIQQGPLTVHVNGDCMNNSLPAGSDARLEGCSFYWPGEVVAFRRGANEIVSHRFLGYFPGRRGWLALTRADNSHKADNPVALDSVLGRVTHVNGVSFRPGPGYRLNAAIGWFPAATRLVITALRYQVTRMTL
jgi:hypothetical protein